MKINRIITTILIVLAATSCNDYLNVTPDNIATIDYAFRMRSTAERFLFTCYSYMPDHGTLAEDPGILGCDELWLNLTNNNNAAYIARGAQKVVNPYLNSWQGGNGGKDLYEGIRQCNIMLENIETVPDMQPDEKRRWAAEAKFLKAYYHYWLVHSYGPVVLIRQNLPVSAGPDEVKIPRSPVDECFEYIVTLLDEAYRDLPERIYSEVTELGRITQGICLSVKAKVLVTAASPLFNGNGDYNGFTNQDGTRLFNPTYDPQKWVKAAEACKTAIDFCEALGHKLYTYRPAFIQYDLSDSTMLQLTLRNAFNEKWNSEIIWGNTNSMINSSNLQRNAHPRGLDPALVANTGASGNVGVPIAMASLFYSENGVPIIEDKTYDYSGRFGLSEGDMADRYYIKQGYTTANFNFRREPRYYAWLGFDGGIWYGQGHDDDDGSDLLYLQCKSGQAASPINKDSYNVTGIFPKKYVHYKSVVTGTSSTFTTENYPWPVIRLADMYLLYAEALNEVHDYPEPDVYNYVNAVRERAGLPTVEDAWTNFSTNPAKFTSKDGMREIIHRERTVELAFEGKRFWDVRRWKTATIELNQSITGWDVEQSLAQGYYRERFVENQTFNTRDYLWPLNENCILANPTLVQNPGWK